MFVSLDTLATFALFACVLAAIGLVAWGIHAWRDRNIDAWRGKQDDDARLLCAARQTGPYAYETVCVARIDGTPLRESQHALLDEGVLYLAPGEHALDLQVVDAHADGHALVRTVRHEGRVSFAFAAHGSYWCTYYPASGEFLVGEGSDAEAPFDAAVARQAPHAGVANTL
jgi:hypothetical protein